MKILISNKAPMVARDLLNKRKIHNGIYIILNTFIKFLNIYPKHPIIGRYANVL